MREYKILIPIRRDSDKYNHANDVYRDWEDYLAAVFGGYTVDYTRVTGAWRDSENELVTDFSITYYVATDASDEHLRNMAAYAARVFDNQCIYIAETSHNVRLITKTGEDYTE